MLSCRSNARSLLAAASSSWPVGTQADAPFGGDGVFALDVAACWQHSSIHRFELLVIDLVGPSS